DMWNVAIHEAGHVVVAWYLGMAPTSARMGSEIEEPLTEYDRSEYNRCLPGGGLIRSLTNSMLRAVQLVAGGCAELAVGVQHEKCGWSGDFEQFNQHLNAVSEISGYTYDHCWQMASAMAKEILDEPPIWDAVNAVARGLQAKGKLDREDLARLIENRERPRVESRVATVLKFVSTPRARALEAFKTFPSAV
ncbi:MAG: hypothetical protein LC667_21030, partial [Thioalkalivibrio sp.]|nr:hypothetical protein [Thioalkalivibrio sp.]